MIFFVFLFFYRVGSDDLLREMVCLFIKEVYIYFMIFFVLSFREVALEIIV